jgi:hypothetical protein
MNGKSKSNFAIIRVNRRTYVSGGVVAVVKGEAAAEKCLLDFEGGQSEEDRFAGWAYFIERTDLTPGMDAKTATRLRQEHLDRLDANP